MRSSKETGKPVSISRANQRPFLEGYRVKLTPTGLGQPLETRHNGEAVAILPFVGHAREPGIVNL